MQQNPPWFLTCRWTCTRLWCRFSSQSGSRSCRRARAECWGLRTSTSPSSHGCRTWCSVTGNKDYFSASTYFSSVETSKGNKTLLWQFSFTLFHTKREASNGATHQLITVPARFRRVWNVWVGRRCCSAQSAVRSGHGCKSSHCASPVHIPESVSCLRLPAMGCSRYSCISRIWQKTWVCTTDTCIQSLWPILHIFLILFSQKMLHIRHTCLSWDSVTQTKGHIYAQNRKKKGRILNQEYSKRNINSLEWKYHFCLCHLDSSFCEWQCYWKKPKTAQE